MFSKQFDQNEYFSAYCSLWNEMERNEAKWNETKWKSVVCEMKLRRFWATDGNRKQDLFPFYMP